MLKTVPIRLVTLMIPERAESGTAAKIRLSDSTENMFTAKSLKATPVTLLRFSPKSETLTPMGARGGANEVSTGSLSIAKGHR